MQTFAMPKLDFIRAFVLLLDINLIVPSLSRRDVLVDKPKANAARLEEKPPQPLGATTAAES
jgi:hypothetical protein